MASFPWTASVFRVKAHNAQGWSKASLPSEQIQTDSGLPVGTVTDVRLSRRKHDIVELRWEPLPRQSWGASGLGYLVQWEVMVGID